MPKTTTKDERKVPRPKRGQCWYEQVGRGRRVEILDVVNPYGPPAAYVHVRNTASWRETAIREDRFLATFSRRPRT